MKKLTLLGVLCLFFCTSLVHASVSDYIENPNYTPWKITNVWKSGHEHHLGMPGGVKLLEPGTYGTMLVANNGSHGAYTAKLEDGWQVDIYFDVWGKDDIDQWSVFENKARCTGGSDCVIDEWKYLTQTEGKLSTLSRGDEVYMIKNLWGQKGFNAGGINVKAEDRIATGFWFDLYQKEPLVVCLERDANGCGEPNWERWGRGDINGNKVPIPAAWVFFTFGLVGLRALGIIRKKDA